MAPRNTPFGAENRRRSYNSFWHQGKVFRCRARLSCLACFAYEDCHRYSVRARRWRALRRFRFEAFALHSALLELQFFTGKAYLKSDQKGGMGHWTCIRRDLKHISTSRHSGTIISGSMTVLPQWARSKIITFEKSHNFEWGTIVLKKGVGRPRFTAKWLSRRRTLAQII